MHSHTLNRTCKDSAGVTHGEQEIVSADGEKNFDDVVNTAVTDKEIQWSCTRARLQSIFMISSQDITIETNNAATPTDSIALKANRPLIWSLSNDGLARCPFTADVTKLFATNASGTNANFKIRALEDITP